MKDTYIFRPRAKLLLQLGNQLIKNENIAVVELIKNAYDADATKVEVTFNNLDSAVTGEINILDNGTGMTLDTIKNVWLEPGNTYKNDMVLNRKRTALGRLPIGEKGIGRFGAHKLGNEIEIITRAKGKEEIKVKIDWSSFNNDDKYLSDIPIEISTQVPIVFVGDNTGTLIKIRNLNAVWSKEKYLDLRRAIDHFNSPFVPVSDFKIGIKTNMAEWDEKILNFDDIKKMALYHYSSTIFCDGTETFNYEFIPYSNMELDAKNISQKRNITDKNGHPFYTSSTKIGVIKFELYCFDRDSGLLTKYMSATNKKQFKKYLDENGGICIFRDGIRIYDYGEQENDWLGLDHARLNQPGMKISNNIIVGAIHLDRTDSTSLIEKTNREGLVENEAYTAFKNTIKNSLDNFITYRNIDKNRIRMKQGNRQETIIHDIKIIKQKIDLCDIKEKEKKDISSCLDKLEKDYNKLKEVNLMTTSAGLSYSIVIHEIEKIIKELKIRVMKEDISSEIKETVFNLSETVQSYSELIRQRKKESTSTSDLIKQSIFNCSYRLKVHAINCIADCNNDNEQITCSYGLVVGAILNILDNSIWWLNKYNIKDKNILFKVSKYKKGYTSIVIADNGLGFTINPEDAIKPFVTQKNGGIGLGLNIVNEIMIANNGILDFPAFEEIQLPEIFKNGAIVSLCFKNGAKK